MLSVQGDPGPGSSEFLWLAVLQPGLWSPDCDSIIRTRWQLRSKPGLLFGGGLDCENEGSMGFRPELRPRRARPCREFLVSWS